MKNVSELNSTAPSPSPSPSPPHPPPHITTSEHNFLALIFGIFLIVVIICGNILVCLSVCKEKALKTTTNYFIVSLAVADLLLAVLVLPLFVYAEVRPYTKYIQYTDMCIYRYDTLPVLVML